MEENIFTIDASAERFYGRWYALDFSRWKRSFLPAFIGSKAQLQFIKAYELPQLKQADNVLVWSSKLSLAIEQKCKQAGARLWRMEDGFVRSIGLGVDLVPPLSLVLDSRGIYYDASSPSDLEILLGETRFDDALLCRAENIREKIVSLKLSKYNVGRSEFLALPTGRRLILVPGQVETDASIDKGSPEIKTNRALLTAVREANPDAFIIYKPHPDVVGGGRYGALKACPRRCLFDLELTDTDITDLLNRVDEVHTMSSLTGFEALLRGIKVVTYGMPFYAGWGLTSDYCRCPRRGRKLSLDELVAGVLINYPVYVDPASGDHINVEAAIDLLVRQRDSGLNQSFKKELKSGFYRLIRNTFLKC